MKKYKPLKSSGIIELIFYLLISIGLIYPTSTLVNDYLKRNLLLVILMIAIVYISYYILLYLTLEYEVLNDSLCIKAFFGFKNIRVLKKDINGFMIKKGKIEGFKLSGFGKHKVSLGRAVIKNVGVTRMFITSNEKMIFIHTDESSYGISPLEFDSFLNSIEEMGVLEQSFEIKLNKNKELFKEKNFLIPLVLVSIIIVFITLTPLILYYRGIIPKEMPIIFDANFKSVTIGTGKQFVFRQMLYGVLNMIVLFCMYYAAYFSAKYDKKVAERYLYISFIISLIFLVIQLKTITIYI